ncbi:MAG: DNA-binding protein [Desulfovibrionaceae bacterium]|nr:DNA-binding protein [Desulfovibrionaceae bacterium]
MTQYKMSISHQQFMTEVLRADPEFSAFFLRNAIASLDSDDPEERAVNMMVIHHVAQAYCDFDKLAQDAGISREELDSALSPEGNPTLSTLQSVLGSVGLRLSAEPVQKLAAVSEPVVEPVPA